jgi:GNAT superfamily N-acetyltransferase
VTCVLLDESGCIAGFYSFATGQIDFGDLPPDLAKKLPRRNLPIAILAWLGVSSNHQGHGLGTRLLAQPLSDCYVAGRTFAFIAVIIDCLNQDAKRFYQLWDIEELPGNPFRLYLSAKALEKMIRGR